MVVKEKMVKKKEMVKIKEEEKKQSELDELIIKASEDVNNILKKYGLGLQPYAVLTPDGRISANVKLVPST